MEKKPVRIRIPLPEMDTTMEAGAHPYSFQIAKQTETFIAASIWHISFLDAAAGRYIRLPWGLWRVRRMFKVTDSAWRRGLDSFLMYRQVFEKSVLQTIVISMKSHWDWFVTKSAEFVIFARNHEPDHPLALKDVSALQSIGQNKPIRQQISLLSLVTGINLKLSQSTDEAIQEMTLVRNLGIHNRWEVDRLYLNRSANAANWELGDLRTISGDEVELWERSLITLIRDVAFPIAFKYGTLPSYPE
jgi:hypothetical protein